MAHTCEHGADFFSYQTCLRTQMADGTWVLNVTRYSNVTTRHQREAFGTLRGICLDNISRGVNADDLRRTAEALGREVIIAPGSDYLPRPRR